MDVKTTLREQMEAMHGTLEAAIGDCKPDTVARKLPGSTINSIGAIYAHTIFSEDGLLNFMVRGEAPVYMKDGWASKIAIDMPQGGMEPDWNIKMDLPLFREDAAAVYKATDHYLSSVTDDELERVVDLKFAPPMSIRSFFGNVLAWHAATHQGEVSALKGVQGVDGLVFAH